MTITGQHILIAMLLGFIGAIYFYGWWGILYGLLGIFGFILFLIVMFILGVTAAGRGEGILQVGTRFIGEILFGWKWSDKKAHKNQMKNLRSREKRK